MSIFISLTLVAALSFLSVFAQVEAKVGESAPAIELERMLQGPDASQVNWETLQGRSVLIEFWATWCGPCITAIPHLNELSNKLEGEPIEFISVSNEEEELVKSFLDRHSISGWIGLDTDRSMYAPYGIQRIPHTILVDANGIVRATTHPDHVTENVLRDLIAGKPVDLPPKRDADVFFAIGEEGPEPIFQVMIRPSIRTEGGRRFRPGRITMIAQRPETLIRIAYETEPYNIILETELLEQRYDVDVVDSRKPDLPFPLLRQAVSAGLGIEALWEERERKVFVLRKISGKESTVKPLESNIRDYSRRINEQFETSTVKRLVSHLSSVLNTPVIDETGLEGQYDIVIGTATSDPDYLAAEVRNQLGLELTPELQEIEVLVVR